MKNQRLVYLLVCFIALTILGGGVTILAQPSAPQPPPMYTEPPLPPLYAEPELPPLYTEPPLPPIYGEATATPEPTATPEATVTPGPTPTPDPGIDPVAIPEPATLILFGIGSLILIGVIKKWLY